VAPRLAERFTVIRPDLRGYGDSGAPEPGADHAGYSKRAMAADMAELMAHLGFARYGVAGHDRGGRVGHRLALDHASHVSRLAVLDITPTHHMYHATDMAFARAYYHWFFLIQPHDLPERLIGADPEYFLRWTLTSWCKTPGAIEEEAVRDYLRCFRRPEVIHATCEDYRAAASIDLAHDEADMHVRLACPVLVLWGAEGVVGRMFDPPAAWRQRADKVSGHAVPGGHFVPEEAPEETAAALMEFFGRE
jgi:haloacetate dehalogenase